LGKKLGKNFGGKILKKYYLGGSRLTSSPLQAWTLALLKVETLPETDDYMDVEDSR